MGIGIAHTILILKISVSTIILRITDVITFLLNVYFSSFVRIRKSDDLIAIFFLNLAKEKKNMTNGEERIADYFLDKKTLLRKQSSRSIASQLFINPSMITRFCQKLGFHGYTDFLEEYLKEIEYTESHFQDLDPNHPFDDQDKNTVIANKIGQLYHEIVDNTLKLL